MIRRLIILLLIIGCVFGDTIAYKNYIGLNNMYSGVKYLGIKDNKVYYRKDTRINSVNCNKVFEIINSYGNKIEFNCSSNTYKPKTLTELDAKKNSILSVGGVCIAIGAGLVFTTLGKECGDDCELKGTSQSALEKWAENNEKFADGILDTQKIGFGLLALGGILVAFGI
jgi:hypothetical protein